MKTLGILGVPVENEKIRGEVMLATVGERRKGEFSTASTTSLLPLICDSSQINLRILEKANLLICKDMFETFLKYL